MPSVCETDMEAPKHKNPNPEPRDLKLKPFQTLSAEASAF